MSSAPSSLAIANPQDTTTTLAEIERQMQTARDYVVSPGALQMSAISGTPILLMRQGGFLPPMSFEIDRIAHEQLADKTGIGQHYYRRLLSAPEHVGLLKENVNYWLQDREIDRRFTIRTLDNRVRAVLSDIYFIIDNFPLAMTAARAAGEMSAVIQRLDLSPERFYMRILHPEWAVRLEQQAGAVRTISSGSLGNGIFGGITDRQGGIAHSPDTARTVQFDEKQAPQAPGARNLERAFEQIALHPDWIIPGVTISNSEVGRGGLMVEPFIYQTYCTNTAFFAQAFGRVHRGAKNLEGLLSETTKQKQADLILSEVSDIIHGAFDPVKFRNHIEQFLGLQELQLEDASRTVQEINRAKNIQFTDGEIQQIMNQMIYGGDTTAWGLVNAVTATARETQDTDRRIEIERMGGSMIEQFPRELVRVR